MDVYNIEQVDYIYTRTRKNRFQDSRGSSATEFSSGYAGAQQLNGEMTWRYLISSI